MSIEQQIVEWAASRPSWQRAILRRIASGDVLTETDYQSIAEKLVNEGWRDDEEFLIDQMPTGKSDSAQVCMLALIESAHVNALRQVNTLSFAPDGMTVVYGDNASGKSGYARVIKKVVRARHIEEVLTDIFHDQDSDKPTARIKILVGGNEVELDWPSNNTTELARIGFYDDACGDKYVTSDLEIGYRPSALFVVDGLIQACDAIRKVLEEQLANNTRAKVEIPVFEAGTEAAEFVRTMSALTTDEDLDTACTLTPTFEKDLVAIRDEEKRLLGTDPTKEKALFIKAASKLERIADHLDLCVSTLGSERESELQVAFRRLTSAREAANAASKVIVQVGYAILVTSGSRGDFLDHFDHLAEGIDRKGKMCCNGKNAGRGDTYCPVGARASGQG